MTELIKLTDADSFTRSGRRNAMRWGAGVTNDATGEGFKLCTNGVIHAYKTPLLAVLMDPSHANYLRKGGIAWLAMGNIVADDGLKIGCKRLTTVRRVDLPKVTKSQNTAFGILSVMEVCHIPKWRLWADNWLTGKNRSEEAATVAYRATWGEAPLNTSSRAARAALYSSANATDAALYAAEAAYAANAADLGIKIDFAAIAEKAMQYK